jgi:hypothetical protein
VGWSMRGWGRGYWGSSVCGLGEEEAEGRRRVKWERGLEYLGSYAQEKKWKLHGGPSAPF